jgi:hypothetical protein
LKSCCRFSGHGIVGHVVIHGYWHICFRR